MINNQLKTYIEGEQAKGKTLEVIKDELLTAGGWNVDDIVDTFESIKPGSMPVSESTDYQKIRSEKRATLFTNTQTVLLCVLFLSASFLYAFSSRFDLSGVNQVIGFLVVTCMIVGYLILLCLFPLCIVDIVYYLKLKKNNIINNKLLVLFTISFLVLAGIATYVKANFDELMMYGQNYGTSQTQVQDIPKTDTNSITPTINTQSTVQYKAQSLPPILPITNWKHIKLSNFDFPYPQDWKIVPPEEPQDRCSIMCEAAMAMEGKLATRLVPPSEQNNELDYNENTIYIGSDSETADSECSQRDSDFYSYCYTFKQGFILYTFSKQDDVLAVAHTIIDTWEKANNIKHFLNPKMSFDYPGSMNASFDSSKNEINIYPKSNVTSSHITIHLNMKCSDNTSIIKEPNDASKDTICLDGLGQTFTNQTVQEKYGDGYIATKTMDINNWYTVIDILNFNYTLVDSGNYDWDANIPKVTEVLKGTYGDMVGADHEVSIGEKADVTGDGVDDAFVNLGTGGATTDFYALMIIDNNKPTIAKYKEEDGTINSDYFMDGAGGGGNYHFGIYLDTPTNSVVTSNSSVYGDSTDTCGSSALTWNPATKLFEYNKKLSKAKTDELLIECYKQAADQEVTFGGKK